MATEHGAKTTAFGESIGRLDPGRFFDAVLINWRTATYPYQDPDIPVLDAVMQRAKTGAVDAVFVDGEIVYADGRFTKVDRDAVLARAAYKTLGLQSYFTAGEKEVRAWTFRHGMTAPQCAGVIHTDFEKGFVKAEVVSYEDLVKNGSVAAAREAGRYRLEGKSYLFKDGDVALFRFTD